MGVLCIEVVLYMELECPVSEVLRYRLLYTLLYTATFTLHGIVLLHNRCLLSNCTYMCMYVIEEQVTVSDISG